MSLKETAPPQADPAARPYLLDTTSLDTPGIVHAVTSLLRKHRVNILDLETDTTPAPWTGAPMFHMRARLSVPGPGGAGCARSWRSWRPQTNLDIRLTPVTPEPADE